MIDHPLYLDLTKVLDQYGVRWKLGAHLISLSNGDVLIQNDPHWIYWHRPDRKKMRIDSEFELVMALENWYSTNDTQPS